MLKLLLLVLVIGVFAWLTLARRRPPSVPCKTPRAGNKAASAAPTPMLACAHCGVHLPQADAIVGPDAVPYCSDAHRLAGPR